MTFKQTRGTIVYRTFVPGQATAGTVDDWTLMVVEFDIKLIALKFVPNAAITANATNFFDLNLINKGAAAGGSTVMATRSWAATNSVAFVAESLTNSATAANLLASTGDVLDLNRTIAASGLAMPDMLVEVHYQLTGI